ncbi:succinyl-CoA ligase [ADP-forming] subunit beta [Acrasis kona]|uniref:Succinyl-CoA ligase [ADP-forming] subunit beta n=1 Tax=Acrasis kona TaxID=1008807 RepID=A0AAW2ZR39_9EUKA
MPKATWNGVVIAETDTFEKVEGNTYFPPSSIKKEYFKDSPTHTTCGWKGKASYYTIEVDGKQNKDAAWYYPTPYDAAKNIAGYVAFWKGVQVEM